MSIAKCNVFGHSFATGSVADHWWNGCIDLFDYANDGFSKVENLFSAADTPYLSDSFDRADAGTLGDTDGGGLGVKTWTALTGTWSIISNTAGVSASHGTKPNIAYIDMGEDDGLIEVATSTVVSTMGLAWRIQDEDNYYYIRCETGGGGSIALWKREAGVETLLSNVISGMANGNKIYCAIRGTTMTISNSSATGSPIHKITYTDSTFPTGGKIGMRTAVGVTTPRFDSFKFSRFYVDAAVDCPAPEQFSGMWALRSGSLVNLSPWNSTDRAVVAWETGQSDGQIEVEIGTYLVTTSTGIALRVQDKDNCIMVRHDRDAGIGLSTLTLQKRVAGVNSTITSISGDDTYIFPGSPGARLRITMCGTRIRVWSNTDDPADPQEYNVSEFSTNTKHGLWTGVSNTAAVNFPNIRYTALQTLANGATDIVSVRPTSGWVPCFKYFPRLSFGDVGIILHHLNDIHWLIGDTEFRADKAIRECTRSVISNMLARAVYEDSDPTCSYSGFSLVADDTFATGSGYRAATAPGSTVTITTTPGYLGGNVAIKSIAVPGDGGAQCSVTVNGEPYTTIDTSGIFASGSDRQSGMVTRVTNLAPGVNTIVVTVDTVDGAYWFDGWNDEPLDRFSMPRILLCNVPRLTQTGYGAFFGFVNETRVNQCNGIINDIASEFPIGVVRIVDIDGLLNRGYTGLMYTDEVHPNTAGQAAIANLFMQTLATSPTVLFTPGSVDGIPPFPGGSAGKFAMYRFTEPLLTGESVYRLNGVWQSGTYIDQDVINSVDVENNETLFYMGGHASPMPLDIYDELLASGYTSGTVEYA